MAITKRSWRLSAYSTFGSLAVFYFGTVALVLSAMGWSLPSPTTRVEWAFLISILQRLVGGVLCLAVLVALAASPRGRRCESEGRAARQKRSRQRYVFATFGQLSIADQWQVIDRLARPERFELPTLRFEA